MLDQAGWWSGWLVLVEHDLRVPGLGSWTPIASPAALQTKLAVSNETGGQGAVTPTGAPDTWKWDPIHTLGYRGKTGRDWEGEGVKKGGWMEEEGHLAAVRGLSDRSRKVAEQQNSSKGLWVTRDERHISAYTTAAGNSPVWLVCVFWQAYKEQSCSIQGLLSRQVYQENVAHWSTFRTSEYLITFTEIQSASCSYPNSYQSC